MGRRQNTTAGWPVIIAIVLVCMAGTAAYSWLVTPQGLVEVAWLRGLLKHEAGAVAAIVGGFVCMLLYRNTRAPQAAINAGLLILVISCLAVPPAVMKWQQGEQARARQAVLPVFITLRTAIHDLDKAYIVQTSDMQIPALVEPEALARGFNAARARADLKTAREANTRHHAEVQKRIAEGRAKLKAIPLGRRATNALASFDGEFVYKSAGPTQLRAYETYELDLLDFEVEFLAKNQGRWRSDGDRVALATDALVEQYDGIKRQRASNERYLERLRRFNADQALRTGLD